MPVTSALQSVAGASAATVGSHPRETRARTAVGRRLTPGRPSLGRPRPTGQQGARGVAVVVHAEVGPVVGAPGTQPSRQGSPMWAAFAEAASGEWEGATSTFGPDGSVRQLPDYYVPDAYKEWGIEVVDWTHMTSTLVTDDGLSNAVKKFMPTVGCEADAVAFVEDTQLALRTLDEHSGEAKTIDAQGSYSLGPRELATAGQGFAKQRIEACVMGGSKQRVRVVYVVQRRDGDSPWKVFSIEVFKETYVGEYEGGTDLRSCGGADGYGGKPRTALEQVCGTWERRNGVAYTCSNDLSFESCDLPSQSRREVQETDLVCLPQGVWSHVSSTGPEDIVVEAGFVFEDSQQRVVSRQYASNKVTSITIVEEGRVAGASGV